MSVDIKSGYKGTDLGVIPESWDVSDLKSLRFDISDGNYSSKYPKASDFKNIGIPFIRANNISGMTVQDADMRFISSEQHKELSKGHTKNNDILVTTRGEIGQIAFVPEQYFDANINAQIVRINTAGSGVNHKFLGYYLLSDQAQTQIQNLQTGSALKQLPVGRLLQVKIAIPPANVQETIAESLYDIDYLIKTLDQLIAKKRDIQQAAMQQLLTGQRRLPGFSGEWEVKRIGDFTDCTAGGTPSTYIDDYWGGSIRWMNSGELNLKRVYEVEGRITEAGLQNSSTRLVPANCVLIGLAGQGRTRGTVAINYVELCTNQSIAAIFPNNSFSFEYLYYNLEFRYEELRELSSGGGGRGGLNLTLIRSLQIPFPSVREQTAIATLLSDMDTELTALQTRRDKARQIKQGMMQELLTGRIRLK